MQNINCPKCGETIKVNSLGRKPLAIPVIKVYDALRVSPSLAAAAQLLDCSRGYIYRVLKNQNVTLKEVLAVYQSLEGKGK